MTDALEIKVRGVVQGVGFRPFVYQLAAKNSLKGFVLNTSGDVTIVVEGDSKSLQLFTCSLKDNGPPQALIESISVQKLPSRGFPDFRILESRPVAGAYQLVSPDLATCDECKTEIFDPSNRRYRYPFTNCTNCGPRFTIIQDIPYDRPNTTMGVFQMCPECQAEYQDPGNRRFHAQPNACPVCGPRLTLRDAHGQEVQTNDVVSSAVKLLKEGKIFAIKGLGGFLLACDALNPMAVQTLRQRKQRPGKPFAIMVKDIEEAKKYCQISAAEVELLASAASPIVLLEKNEEKNLAPQVAPGLNYLGLMLAYTPLHHLLLSGISPLVMTSGNLSEEPIAKENFEASQRLEAVADYFVLHDRGIFSSYDDSVTAVIDNQTQVVRRARGFAPHPISLPFNLEPVLACGAELENTFCLTRDNHAFLSQHIGDMENLETLDHFEHTIRLYKKLFRVEPRRMAVDLHPDFLGTRWGETEAGRGHLPLSRIQHHHAHIASCLADNQARGPVIGIAFDGTGYGPDGKIWGGEFLVADYASYFRRAYFEYLPLPGANLAIVKPYRLAIGYLYSLLGERALDCGLPCFKTAGQEEVEMIVKQIDLGLNTPLTSSAGRLFDAVSALLGIRLQINYKGQAAIELEMAAGKSNSERIYPFDIASAGDCRIIKLASTFAAIIQDMRNNCSLSEIAVTFHNTMAAIIVRISSAISQDTGLKTVALSGGVFQNRRLLSQVSRQLVAEGFVPLIHRQAPCNDGGISLGQALIANFLKE